MSVIKNKNADGTISLDVVCDFCGKPATKFNEFGAFCEDECGLEEAKLYSKNLDELVDKLMNVFGEED